MPGISCSGARPPLLYSSLLVLAALLQAPVEAGDTQGAAAPAGLLVAKVERRQPEGSIGAEKSAARALPNPAEPESAPAGRGAPSAGSQVAVRKLEVEESGERRSKLLPWVQVNDLTPESAASKSAPEKRPQILPPWALYDHDSSLARSLTRVDSCRRPLLHCPQPRESRFARAAKAAVERRLYREARRRMKKAWRRACRHSPSVSYDLYAERMARIRQVGRWPEREMPPLRDDERDAPLLGWGPFVLSDSGSLRLDLGRLKEPRPLDEVEIESEEETAYRPILHSRNYRVHTSVRLNFDPLKAVRESDVTWAIKSYGLNVDIEWFTDVLGRKVMATELEFQLKRTGDWAVMVNFVFNSRRPPPRTFGEG
jgi:hypothetical protein